MDGLDQTQKVPQDASKDVTSLPTSNDLLPSADAQSSPTPSSANMVSGLNDKPTQVTDSSPIPDLSSLMDSPQGEQILPPGPPPSDDPPQTQKKKQVVSKKILIAVLLFFLVSIPLIGVFVSQRNSLADLRNRAEDVYPRTDCGPEGATNCNADGRKFRCQRDPSGPPDQLVWVESGLCSGGGTCSTDSDGQCAGRGSGPGSACTTASQSGSCASSSIIGSDGFNICTCAVNTPVGASPTPIGFCLSEGALSCLNNQVVRCENSFYVPTTNPPTSCSISCNNSSGPCSGKTIASNCGTNAFCQQTAMVNGNPTCSCQVSGQPTPTLTPIPTGGTNPTPLPTGTNQCQDGNNNRDQQKVLVCNCGNSCSFKTDSSAGGGGSGWVCDQNCHLEDADGSYQLDTCSQIDYVHNGTSNYCGVAQINCPTSCQGGGNTPNPSPTSPTNPTPTVVGQCTNLAVRKDGDIVNPATLQPGDQIRFVVAGTNAQRARVRVNGKALNGVDDWTILTTKNIASEFVTDLYTVPTGVINFSVDAQVEITTDNWL